MSEQPQGAAPPPAAKRTTASTIVLVVVLAVLGGALYRIQAARRDIAAQQEKVDSTIFANGVTIEIIDENRKLSEEARRKTVRQAYKMVEMARARADAQAKKAEATEGEDSDASSGEPASDETADAGAEQDGADEKVEERPR